mgnify:CR=1 FL=1
MVVQNPHIDTYGYTEYGYRGLEEVKAKDKIIEQLKQENAKLKTQNQLLENKANDLQAKASIPRY